MIAKISVHLRLCAFHYGKLMHASMYLYFIPKDIHLIIGLIFKKCVKIVNIFLPIIFSIC